MKTTATIDQLDKALKTINSKYDNNIRFKVIKDISSKRVQFTITVNDSKGPGARRSAEGRRIAAACWHVHGELFDSLWAQDPDTLIIAGPLRMTGWQDNWQDRNIGSMYQPLMHSQACECNLFKLKPGEPDPRD